MMSTREDHARQTNVPHERREVARKLQDNVEQLLTAAVIELGTLVRDTQSSEITGEIEHARALCRQALALTRAAVSELDPPVLYELGLVAALEWLVEQQSLLSGIEIEFEDRSAGQRIAAETADVLFQGARTTLRAIVSQARACRARVRFAIDDGTCWVDIHDDVGTRAMLFAPVEPGLPTVLPVPETTGGEG